jgi:uncharacterized protein YrrD
MLRHASEINGYSIGAADGPIGKIKDILFDDATWMARWIVVDTGQFLSPQRVLLPTSVLSHVNHIARQFAVRLTKAQIEDSPSVETDEPVSRIMETNLYDYYGWSPYWSTSFYMGGYGYGGGLIAPAGLGVTPRVREADAAREANADKHLRSAHEVTGYHIHAEDGDIGHVSDILIEDQDWSIHYMVVDTLNWWAGKKVLISPRSIRSISWPLKSLMLNVSRQAIKDSPAYDGSQAIDRAYEYKFHGYYDNLPVAEPV